MYFIKLNMGSKHRKNSNKKAKPVSIPFMVETNNKFPSYITFLEKKETPLLIEGTLRHQDNVVKAKNKYGHVFNAKIIMTKYFKDDEDGSTADVPTLVCCDDESLILGKPRYPEKFTEMQYKIKLIDPHHINSYCIEVIDNTAPTHFALPPQTPTQLLGRQAITDALKNIKEPHCIICGDTENDGEIIKINTINEGIKLLCKDCADIQTAMGGL